MYRLSTKQIIFFLQKRLIPLCFCISVLSSHHSRCPHCGCRGRRRVWQLFDVQQWGSQVPRRLKDPQRLWWWWVPVANTSLVQFDCSIHSSYFVVPGIFFSSFVFQNVLILVKYCGRCHGRSDREQMPVIPGFFICEIPQKTTALAKHSSIFASSLFSLFLTNFFANYFLQEWLSGSCHCNRKSFTWICLLTLQDLHLTFPPFPPCILWVVWFFSLLSFLGNVTEKILWTIHMWYVT